MGDNSNKENAETAGGTASERSLWDETVNRGQDPEGLNKPVRCPQRTSATVGSAEGSELRPRG